MRKETDVESTLEKCRALINQINAGLSAEEPFVDVSSAAELLFYLERAASALERSVSRSQSPRNIIVSVGGGADGSAPASPSL